MHTTSTATHPATTRTRRAGSAAALTALASAALAGLLTGCSSSSSPAPTGSTGSATATAPATASSTSAAGGSSTASSPDTAPVSSAPAVSSSSAAGLSAQAQKFVSLSAPLDSDLQAFLQLPDGTSGAQAKAAAKKLATAESSFITDVQKQTWPATAKADIANLVATMKPEQALYAKCATASSVNAIKTDLTAGKAVIAARIAASTHVRTALGIPQPATAASGSPAAS